MALTLNKIGHAVRRLFGSNFTDNTVEEIGSIDNKLWVTEYDVGVSSDYSKQTANGDTFLIQKGLLNSLRLRPQILNEHAESSRVAQGTVVDGNIVGQIFKASQDNINGINLTMESAAGVDFDDFESYADSTALQAVWAASGATEATLNLSNPHNGDKCMAIDTNALVGSEWERTFVSTDFTDFSGQFYMYCNRAYVDVKMRVFVRDTAGNTSSTAIVTAGTNSYSNYVFPIESLLADGVTAADITDIVGIGFRLESKKAGTMYFDDLVSVPNPGSVDVKLWDMGTTIPVSTTTALDDGTQYTKLGDLGITGQQLASVNVNMEGGKRAYHLDDFIAGVALEIPGNELLNVDHYYAITIHWVDTNVTVYGPNDAWDNYYKNGYGFTAPDESTAITAMGADIDIQFVIFSTQEVYLYEVTVVTSGTPNGGSRTSAYVEDENMQRTDVLVSGIQAVPAITTRLARPFFMGKGYKFEQEYNDDFTDDVVSINLIIQYYFIPPTTNG